MTSRRRITAEAGRQIDYTMVSPESVSVTATSNGNYQHLRAMAVLPFIWFYGSSQPSQRSLEMEYVNQGIRVNVVASGIEVSAS